MCGALFVSDLLRRFFVTHALTLKRIIIILIAEIFLLLAISFTVGIFSAGNGAASGYGIFSLDLNSLLNPDGWSTLIQNMQVRTPNEGFNYLGLGIILLGLLSLFEYARSGDWQRLRTVFLAYWPLFLLGAILTALAISHIVTLCGKEIYHLPLSNFLRDRVFGLIRSSGRLFWPIYYLIFLGSLSVLKKVRRPLAYLIIIGALSLQIYDLNNKLQQIDHFYQNIRWENPLTDPFWQQAVKKYQHISFVPIFIYGYYEPISLLAAQHGLSLNTGLIIRNAGLINEKNMAEERKRLADGIVNEKTLYIFRNEIEAQEMTKQVDLTQHKLIKVDGYSVLAP